LQQLAGHGELAYARGAGDEDVVPTPVHPHTEAERLYAAALTDDAVMG
jgi:hypothetical protein